MLRRLQDAISPSRGKSLAGAFYRLGWAGVWFQVVFGSLPILMMVYYFAFSRSGTSPRSGLRFVEYLTIIDLLILLFTICWSYRYTRLARRITDPERSPSEAQLAGAACSASSSRQAPDPPNTGRRNPRPPLSSRRRSMPNRRMRSCSRA